MLKGNEYNNTLRNKVDIQNSIKM